MEMLGWPIIPMNSQALALFATASDLRRRKSPALPSLTGDFREHEIDVLGKAVIGMRISTHRLNGAIFPKGNRIGFPIDCQNSPRSGYVFGESEVAAIVANHFSHIADFEKPVFSYTFIR